MKTLKPNQKIVVEPNRGGGLGFNADEFREYLYSQYSGSSLNFVGTSVQETFNDVDFKQITVFNNIKYEKGFVESSLINDNISVFENGFYRILAGFSFEFASAEELSIAAFLNGIQLADNPSPVRGEGANKPQIFSWIIELDLVSDDVLDLRAFNNLAGNVVTTFYATYFTVERIG